MIKVVQERIRRNCAVSTRKLGNHLGMSHQSVDLLIKNDLGFKAYKKRQLHGLTDKQKVARVNRCRKLFRLHADSQIIFSDEKMSSYNNRITHKTTDCNHQIWFRFHLEKKLSNDIKMCHR